MAALDIVYRCEGDKCWKENKRYPLDQLNRVWTNRQLSCVKRYCDKCIDSVNIFTECYLCSMQCYYEDGFIEYRKDEHYCTNCLLSYMISDDERDKIDGYKRAVALFQNGDKKKETMDIINYLIQKANTRRKQMKIIHEDERKNNIHNFLVNRLEIKTEDAIIIINRIPEHKLDEIYEQRLGGMISSRKFILSLLK